MSELPSELDEALSEAIRQSVVGNALTPFLLSRMSERSGGATRTARGSPVTRVAGMLPGSTPLRTPRYSSVVVDLRPSSHR